MLHILWLIIKFILIILGIVLGLLLLAVALVLFCPVRYRITGKKETEEWTAASAVGKVSWLASLFALHVNYQNGKFKFAFLIAGTPLEKILQRRKDRIEKKKAAKKKKNAKKRQKEKKRRQRKKQNSAVSKKETQSKKVSEQEPQPQKETNIKKHDETAVRKKETAKAELSDRKTEKIEESTQKKESIQKKADAQKKENIQKKENTQKKENLFSKMRAIPQKIKAIIKKTRSTIQKLSKKAGWWKGFLTHPMMKKALALVWKEAKGLLRHSFPTRISGEVVFGNEDPAVTGAVLAVLGMTIPFHKNCVTVTPVFRDENHLTGEVRMKGRIYGIVLLKIVIKLYFDKNLRHVVSEWRQKED